jgi:hypothetical protein
MRAARFAVIQDEVVKGDHDYVSGEINVQVVLQIRYRQRQADILLSFACMRALVQGSCFATGTVRFTQVYTCMVRVRAMVRRHFGAASEKF